MQFTSSFDNHPGLKEYEIIKDQLSSLIRKNNEVVG
jgi:hypothetical protein